MSSVVDYRPYISMVSAGSYPTLSVLLLALGLVFLALFSLYEMKNSTKTRSIFAELFLAVVASCFLGTGTMFLMLWIGMSI